MEKPIDILLVDDDRTDIELTHEIMILKKIKLNIYVVHDGTEAIDFLYKRNRFKNAVRPDLILLDLNMPRMNGQEVLNVLKGCSDLCSIPVFLLTNSESDAEIIEGYCKGAEGIIMKPIDLEQLQTVVTATDDFWFTIIKTPERELEEKKDV